MQETHPTPFNFHSKNRTGDNLAVRPSFANLPILWLKSSCFSPYEVHLHILNNNIKQVLEILYKFPKQFSKLVDISENVCQRAFFSRHILSKWDMITATISQYRKLPATNIIRNSSYDQINHSKKSNYC